MQIRDRLRPSRGPGRTLHEARFEEAMPALILEVIIVPEPNVRGGDGIHEGGYAADGVGRRWGGRGGGGRGREGALAELVQRLHPRRRRPRGHAPRHWVGRRSVLSPRASGASVYPAERRRRRGKPGTGRTAKVWWGVVSAFRGNDNDFFFLVPGAHCFELVRFTASALLP